MSSAPRPAAPAVRVTAPPGATPDGARRPRALRLPNPPTGSDGTRRPEAETEVPHDGVLVVVGPNGSGKTRLGAEIEAAATRQLGTPGYMAYAPGASTPARAVRRIGAQRVVTLPDTVPLLSSAEARTQLERGGATNPSQTRLAGDAVVGQMQDYGAVVQALFADRNAMANAFLDAAASADGAAPVPVPRPVLDRVVALWEALYPHRRLVLADQTVRARPAVPDPDAVTSGLAFFPGAPFPTPVHGPPPEYPAGQLSDGERAGLYLIAHALLADPGTTLLVDEPETYLHPDLQRRLWDALEAARPDCAFVYLTHNLDFAASRLDAPKVVVRDYRPPYVARTGMRPAGHGAGGAVDAAVGGASYPTVEQRAGFWTWEVLAPSADLPEDVALRIAGSRRPTLFVEGTAGSVDAALYAALYPGRDVVPAGSCEAVIRNVRALGAVPRAHRLAAAGIVDGDDRDAAERGELAAVGVHALRYAQVENVYADERVFRAVVARLAADPDARFTDLRARVARLLSDVRQRDALVRRRALRALDRRLATWAAPAGAAPADEAGFAAAFARAAGDGAPGQVVAGAFAAAAREVDAARAALADRVAATSGEAGETQGDAGYRRALAVLRHKGIGAEVAAAAELRGPEAYRRLALLVLGDDPALRGALTDVVPGFVRP